MSMEPSFALPIGYRLRQYELRRILDYQSFCITYLAHDLGLDLAVVIRELLPHDLAIRSRDDFTVIANSSKREAMFGYVKERFIEDGRILSKLHHASVLSVRDLFEENGTAYLIYPFIKGETLEEWLTKRGTPSEKQLCALLCALLNALEMAHEANSLHLDIKPENILIEGKSGLPILIGFANASALRKLKTPNLAAILTPHYAPFEQYQTNGRLGPWTDLYALGAVLYRAVTGKVPPSAVDRHPNDPILRLAELATFNGYSPSFLAMIEKSLRPRSAERWQSASEWLEALEIHSSSTTPSSNNLHLRLRRAMSSLFGLVCSPKNAP
jgi:serine/threonine protein kinase